MIWIFCSCARSLQCELDTNCPYLILLECVEQENGHSEKGGIIDAMRLKCIDQHFVSYRHANDYLLSSQGESSRFTRRRPLSRMRGNHLTRRTRRLINSKGPDMGNSNENFAYFHIASLSRKAINCLFWSLGKALREG